jgi:translation initiation factor 4E
VCVRVCVVSPKLWELTDLFVPLSSSRLFPPPAPSPLCMCFLAHPPTRFIPNSLFNNLLDPSRLPQGHTYSLFKQGIRPEWEDPALKQGGEWRVQLSRDTVDRSWVDTVLALIGEAFDAPESDDIAGIVLNIRKGTIHRVAIWTKGASGDEVLRNIANRWRQVAIQSSDQIEYLSFQMLKNKVKKPKFVV